MVPWFPLGFGFSLIFELSGFPVFWVSWLQVCLRVSCLGGWVDNLAFSVYCVVSIIRYLLLFGGFSVWGLGGGVCF